MKKIFSSTGIVILVLALLVYVGLTFFLGGVVKAAVNRIGPSITKTAVVLDGANLSPLTGSGTLRGLSVDNPQGWSKGRVFYLGKIHVSMKPFSIFGDHIVIDEIDIDQPEFTYETKIFSSNLGDLLNNIKESTGGANKADASSQSSSKPLKVEIRHFRLTNGKVKLGVGSAALPLPMPPVELHDLGTKEGGITPDQMAAAVLGSVTSSVVSATTQAASQIGSTAGAAAAEGVKKTGENLKKLFGK
ncbi:MAG: hypothetical protein JSR48_08805 [Verrucomicrobia bacterium]|nr:hypothetical protein [Verrucomicrobiota bacterium]